MIPASRGDEMRRLPLPEIPQQWRWTSLKYLCEISADYGLNVSSNKYIDEGVRLIRTTDINSGGLADEGVYLDPSIVGDGLLQEGDLLLSRSGSVGTSYRYCSEDGPCTFASYLVRFRVRQEMVSKFFHYFFQSKLFEDIVRLESIEATISNVSGSKFARMPVPNPEEKTQSKIAKYLDCQTSQIDGLIDSFKRLLSLLEEKREGTIENLLRDLKNGDEVRLKYIIDSLPGFAFPSDEFSKNPEDIPLLRGINVGVGEIRWEDTVYWPSQRIDEYEDYLLQPGDLVLGMDRPWISDGIRIAQMSRSDCPSLLVQRVLRIRSDDKAEQKYVRMCLESDRFKQYFEPITTGVSVPHISKNQVGEFEVPLPSKSQQESIVQQRGEYQEKKEKLEEATRIAIELLEEKRQAIITEAVTGQIDVSDWEPPDEKQEAIA